jgi:hypothetical protein
LYLTTSLTNYDGQNAPVTGYDRATADGLTFSVSAPVRRPALAVPAARVPRFQHVFLFYLENEDFGQVIGDTAQAPYLNSLLPRSSLLADFFAEEHPSDANYLAWPAAAPSASRSTTRRRRTRCTRSTRATSVTWPTPRTRRGRGTCRAPTDRATTPCT